VEEIERIAGDSIKEIQIGLVALEKIQKAKEA